MDFMPKFKFMDFKKRFCRYLLNHYLGQYLEEKFTLDQLSVDLYNGKGCITDVSLDCRALNQMAEEQSIPVEFLEVRMGTVSIAVPWMNIMNESCQVEVKGLIVSIQPKSRVDNGNSMLNSMFSSMASSMQLAEEFFKTVETEEYNTYQSGQQPMSGLEACAKTIEAVISRIQVTFLDSIIRVERSPREGANVGVALEMHIKSWDYSDESDGDLCDTRFSHKKLSLQGVKIYSDIFKYPPPYSGDLPEPDNEEIDNLILIANLTGPQEVRVRIKTGDAMEVPQVSLDCSFGSLVGLLSPTQAHICYVILDDFLNPPTSSTENLNLRQHVKEKPMDSFDLERMKMELEEMNRRDNIGVRLQHQGWSYADECDDEFLPFKTKSDVFSSVHSTLMEASFMSGTSSMNQSMSESQVSFGMTSGASYTSSPHKSSGPSTLTSKIDKTKFSISIAGAAIVILHEDILTLSSAMGVAPSTVRQMRNFVKEFFDNMGLASVSGRRQVDEIKKKLESACPKSCLRIIAAPVKIEGNVAIDNSTPITSGHISFGYCELVESIKDNCLPNSKPENILTEILTFPDNFDLGGRESLKIEFKNKAYRSRTSLSKCTLRIYLQECHSEFDMSVIDRLNALFQPKLPHIINGTNTPVSMLNQSRSIIFLKLTSPKCSVNFRFPIPDLRKSEDHLRVPYWTRNLRSDSIIFALRDLSFNTCFDSSTDAYEFITQCQECQLFYKTTPNAKPYHFATASANDVNSDVPESTLVGFDKPRVVVSIFPERKSEITSDNGRQDEDDSIANFMFMTNFKSAPSPFSSRRVLHECLSHSEDASAGNFGESVIPGDSDEMNKFMEDTVKNVMYKVDCNLRSVKVDMPSKEFFEELYNRLSMDLLLWEPQGPKQPFPGHEAIFRGCVGPQQFSMCKSGIRLDSDSDSDDDSTFYSPSAKLGRKNRKKKAQARKVLPQGQSEVTINLVIGHGVCSFFTPFEDCLGNIIPERKGQITLEIEEGNLFIVSGYKGNPHLGYLCVLSERATFFHNDLVHSVDLLPRTDPLLRRTIYPSEDGVLAARKAGGGKVKEMLSVAVRIEKDAMKNIKNFKVAIGIKNGTVDYLVTLPNRNWFTQIVDFFDVTDVEVPGYIPSTVITELHVHLWNCAASYSPISLPLRCFLTVENFSISVNIAAQTENKVIRFIAEDAAFFITNKKESVDLRNDYVCLMDMDLFEILLRICLNRNNTSVPQLDLKASNNVLHVRTCSDSIKMLLELLTYVARDGDLADNKDALNDLEEKLGGFSQSHEIPPTGAFAEDDFSGVVPQPQRERRLSHLQSHNEQLHCMVAEAMQENVDKSAARLHELRGGQSRSRNSSDSGSANYSESPGRRGKQSIEIHFEADNMEEEEEEEEGEAEGNESNVPTPAPPYVAGDPIMESTNGLPVSLQMSDEDEEEFCILENDPGVGFIPRSGEPEVRVLTDKPIELIENYFTVPLGKVDILQAPKHYPKPVLRYTVQEMSLVWHLYGGEDFGTGKSSTRTAFRGSSESLASEFSRGDSYDRNDEVDIAVDALNPGAVFSKTKAFESAWEAYESPKNQRKASGENGNNAWRAQGGKGRRHDVLVELQLSKVKFQHEVYPPNTEQASRQVLVINSVEIKDKLKSSLFNKMMYLYTSPTLPKQSFANMVVVKAAHIRPDPQLNIEECCLKVSLLPIRLNIDQDTLLFLYEFFSDVAAGKDEEDDSASSSSARPPSHTPSVESLPVMMVNTKDEESGHLPPPEEETLVDFSDDNAVGAQQDDTASVCSKDPSVDSFKPSAPLYFREVIFSPDVPIRLDYKGKNRYNMTNGPIQCIVMALGQLESAEFRLIRLRNNRGMLGVEKVLTFLASEWIADIKKNQVPSVLGGVDIFIPMHSFVQLFQGIKNLFYLPVEQYQKDGRLAKGLQRGVNAFSTSAAVAVLKLTNRMVQALQGAAEFTYDMVSPGPSVQQQRRRSSAKKKRAQPGDIREGMTNAYNVVREGLGDTAHTIVRVASKENEQKGMPGAVGGVLRLTPTLLVAPVMLAAEATSNVLEGLRSELEPEFRKEAEEKWKE